MITLGLWEGVVAAAVLTMLVLVLAESGALWKLLAPVALLAMVGVFVAGYLSHPGFSFGQVAGLGAIAFGVFVLPILFMAWASLAMREPARTVEPQREARVAPSEAEIVHHPRRFHRRRRAAA